MSDRSLPVTSGEQLALAVFEETVGREGPKATLARAATDITYRKSNVLIDVGDLSLTARKGLNVMHFLASQAPESAQRFDVEVGLFKFLMNYESRNHQHLEKALREAQKSSIRIERLRGNGASTDWISVPLVGAVGVAGGRVYFDFHPAIRRLHLDPQSYTYLSLRTTCVFTSIYAHGLYEHLKSVAWKGSPTEWLPVEEVKRWLGVADTKWLAEFKAFRKEALQKAVDQLCEVSDLHVEYETKATPGTKKVAFIRFNFKPQSGALVASMEHAQEMRSLYETLVKEFGLGHSDIERVTQSGGSVSPERIKAAIEFVRHRMARQTKKVSAPGRLLMKAIEEGWTVPTAEVVTSAGRATAALPAPSRRLRRADAATSPAAPAAAVPERPVQEQALMRQYEEEGEQGWIRYQALQETQRAELRVSFPRTLLYRAVRAQLGREKGAITEAELEATPRLRLVFGQHVLRSLAKAARGGVARKESGQGGLFPAR